MGTVDWPQEVYDALASGKLSAPMKNDGTPRPTVTGGTFRRIGMSACVAACKPELVSHFAPRGQQCCGTRGAAEKLATLRRLRLQQDPSRVIFNADERNGFGCVKRRAIAQGLEALPAKLLWLRQAFGRFYRNDSKVFFRVEDGDEDVITLMVKRGVHQGDAAGMVYFAAGFDEATQMIRAEFPEACIQFFADDMHGDAPDREVVCTPQNGLRPFREGAVSMPMAAAILRR
jgi:hypothetical protein